jgi:hypothetical protein
VCGRNALCVCGISVSMVRVWNEGKRDACVEGMHGVRVELRNAWCVCRMKECVVRVLTEGMRGACVE